MRIGLAPTLLTALSIGALALAFTAPERWKSSQPPASNGRSIDPVGQSVEIGSFPTNLALSPNGRWLAVTCSGSRAKLSIVEAATGKIASQKTYREGLYFGIVFASDSQLVVSQGYEDKIDLVTVSADGELGETKTLTVPGKSPDLALNPAGLALSDDGSRILVANNESGRPTQWAGSVAALDAKTGAYLGKLTTPGFPFGLAQKGGLGLVSSEVDGTVTAFDPASLASKATVTVGSHPTAVLIDPKGVNAYVSNASSDTISVIDLATLKVTRTLLVRPAEVHGLPGCTPLGMSLSQDGKQLFVACADLNAVAVIELESGKVEGYLPTGWYPTAVQATPDGQKLYVSCARGVKTRNPNGKPVGDRGQYILSVMEGALTAIDLPKVTPQLPSLTKVALTNALLGENRQARFKQSFANPGFKHVVYIIKENRTFDQVLGDVPKANGDASLAIYGADVTPNYHALATRFGVFDNFYVCAEVSADGWNWSTGGMTSEYTSRNTVYSYSHGKRSYDFEGSVNDAPVERLDRDDVATPPGGYLWDLCARGGVTYQTYGTFVGSGDSDEKDASGKPIVADNEPVKKALVGHSDASFRQFDMSYPDSEAFLHHHLTPAPRQMKGFGSFAAPSRFSQWKRDFEHQVATKTFPAFNLIRLPRDHTAGGADGLSSPRAMVADNDYAVGQVVEAISHSPYWQDTLICILEDDAQNGYDHVDAHRSPALVISAYNRPNVVDHSFYNTDSMLRTMELSLGLPPMNQFDALAKPFGIFDRKAVNESAYAAILPSRAIVGEVNSKHTYRARESEIYALARDEESGSDMRLNEILWRIAKGPSAPVPNTPGAYR